METTYSETQMSGSQALGSQDSATNPGEGSVFLSGMDMNSSGRQVLLDRTNDSPISGLALERSNGTDTHASKTKGNPLFVPAQTPVTDEVLLLYKAKSLVQMIEPNCIKPAYSLITPYCHLNGYQSSPTRLLAPTPTNTPESAVAPNSFPIANSSSLSKKSDQTIGLYEDLGMSKSPHPEAIDAVELPKNMCTPEKPTTRALLFESVEKDIKSTVSSPSSVVSSEDSQRVSNMEDDNVSLWSVQGNFSSPGPKQQTVDYAQGEKKAEDQANETDECDDEQEEGEAIEDEDCEELCQGLNKVSVHDNGGLPLFVGRHTRFVYNSDDELEREEEVKSALQSPSVMHLRGMPTPRGKHLRFLEGDDDSENASN